MTEAELTNEQKESLYSCLRCVDEDEQDAYTRGWLDCMDVYKYQEFIEKEMIYKACEWLKNNINNYIYNRGGFEEYIPTCGDMMFEDFKKAMEE